MDLDLGLSDHLVLTNLLTYITGGRVDGGTGQLLVSGGTEERFAVMSPYLMHTNLSPIYYPIFFQICKAHFIQYDPKVSVKSVPELLYMYLHTHAIHCIVVQ